MAYCEQCGHDTLMQQSQDGIRYLCGFCGHEEVRCPKCGGRDMVLLPARQMYPDRWVCTRILCGYEEEAKP